MAKVKLGLDDSELTTGLAGAGAKLNAFQQKTVSQFKAAGAAVNNAFAMAGGIGAVTALGGAVVDLLGKFDDISDSAKKLGVDAESFQRITLGAELSGASVDGLTTALVKMEAGLQRGGTEGDKIKKALEGLNINVQAFIDAKPEEKLALLTTGFQKAKEEGRGLSEIQDLFKKQFTELIPLLSTSAAEMKKIAAEEVVSNEDVDRLAAANDQLGIFWNRVKVVSGTSLGTLMAGWDAVDESIKKASDGAFSFFDVIKRHLPAVGAAFAAFDAGDAVKKYTGGIDAPSDIPETVAASTLKPASLLPGLQAAGVIPDSLSTSSIPGLDAATAPIGQSEIELRDKQEMQNMFQRWTSPQELVKPLKRGASSQQSVKERAAGDKYSASMLEALKRNNELLEQLAR